MNLCNSAFVSTAFELRVFLAVGLFPCILVSYLASNKLQQEVHFRGFVT